MVCKNISSRQKLRTQTRNIIDSLKENLYTSVDRKNRASLDKNTGYKISMTTRVKILESLIKAVEYLQDDEWKKSLELMPLIHKRISLNLNQIRRIEPELVKANELYYRNSVMVIYLQIKALKK